MHPRLRKLTRAFIPHSIDALLVSKPVNITYLTEFESEDSWLLVTNREVFYITDARYTLAARSGLKGTGVIVKEFSGSIVDFPFALAKDKGVRRLGFDEGHVTVAQYKVFKKRLPKGMRLAAANQLVENLREIKDSKELKLIRKALTIHKQAHQYLKRIIKPGATEQEIFWKLESFVKTKKAGFSFPPIVASGPNSCLPHAKPTRRRIRNNEIVLIDFGIDVNGYKSDLTRIFFLGKIPNLVKDVYASVSEAQHFALREIKAGVPVANVDRAARNFLAKKNLAQYFGHALGHGVGLEIHESPRVSEKSTSRLKEGMIVTVEPAVYIPNRFGIRVEDMALVTKKGCKVLSANIH